MFSKTTNRLTIGQEAKLTWAALLGVVAMSFAGPTGAIAGGTVFAPDDSPIVLIQDQDRDRDRDRLMDQTEQDQLRTRLRDGDCDEVMQMTRQYMENLPLCMDPEHWGMPGCGGAMRFGAEMLEQARTRCYAE